MKIATYNVNGVDGRLPVLLHWLARSQPDVACLQGSKHRLTFDPTPLRLVCRRPRRENGLLPRRRCRTGHERYGGRIP